MTRLRRGIVMTLILSGTLSACAHGASPPPRTEPGPAEQFPDLPKYVWQPLINVFEKQTRGLSESQQKRIVERFIAKPKMPVRVEVVDLVPNDGPYSMESLHSEAITGVIRSLYCQHTTGDCTQRVKVSVSRGSVAYKAGTGRERLGSITFQHFLQMIAQTLDGFDHEHEHLIINLGVGLDPIKVDPQSSEFKALGALLRRASCMGVLVVAPAGNLTGSIGPLIPASFESTPAPAECTDRAATHAEKRRGYTPLVYAVSALDVVDQKLVTSRPSAQSRLAALGLSVTAPAPSPEHPYTLPLSGTSASTAVVSGVAAAVWSTRPELDAHGVMALVYEGGVPLDGGLVSKRARTDFCLNEPFGPCAGVAARRVFLCGALQRALPQEDLGCVQSHVAATDLPRLPEDRVPKNLPPPPKPCGLTGCEVLRGPMIAQRPLGFVPQGPIPTCPLCRFELNRNLIWGHIYPESVLSNIATAVLHTYRLDSSTNMFVEVNPSFPLTVSHMGGDFTIPVSVGQGTWAAEIDVTTTDNDNVPPLPVMFPPTIP